MAEKRRKIAQTKLPKDLFQMPFEDELMLSEKQRRINRLTEEKSQQGKKKSIAAESNQLNQIHFGFNGNVNLLQHAFPSQGSEQIKVTGFRVSEPPSGENSQKNWKKSLDARKNEGLSRQASLKENEGNVEKNEAGNGHKKTKDQKIKIILEKLKKIEEAFLKECEQIDKLYYIEQENVTLKENLKTFERMAEEISKTQKSGTGRKESENAETQVLLSQVSQLKLELEKVNNECSIALQENKLLKDVNRALKTENNAVLTNISSIEVTKTNLGTLSEEKAQLQEEISFLRVQIEGIKEENTRLKDEKLSLEQTLGEKDSILELLRNQENFQSLEVLRQSQRVKELEVREKSLMYELEKRSKEVRDTCKSSEKIKAQLGLKDVEIDELRNHLRQVKENLTSLDEALRANELAQASQLIQKDQEIFNLKASLSAATAENRGLTQILESKSNHSPHEITLTNENLEKMVIELNTHQSKNEDLVAEKNEKINDLEKKLDCAEAEKQKILRSFSFEPSGSPSPIFRNIRNSHSVEFAEGTETAEIFSTLMEQKEAYETMIKELTAEVSRLSELAKEKIEKSKGSLETSQEVKRKAHEVSLLVESLTEKLCPVCKEDQEGDENISERLLELKKELEKKVNENAELFDLCQRMERESKENIVLKAIFEGKNGGTSLDSVQEMEAMLRSATAENNAYKQEIINLNKKINGLKNQNAFLENQIESFKSSLDAAHGLIKKEDDQNNET